VMLQCWEGSLWLILNMPCPLALWRIKSLA
jgi:hypothetical protein